MSPTSTPLPRYQCHKKVWALKIELIKHTEKGWLIVPSESPYIEFNVTEEYILKHSPNPGGYWVQYEDGYQSYSPAKAFEEGYTRL